METNGRPQGSPPPPTPHPPLLYTSMSTYCVLSYSLEVCGMHQLSYIVGAGVGWMWGGDPCGRPSFPRTHRSPALI